MKRDLDDEATDRWREPLLLDTPGTDHLGDARTNHLETLKPLQSVRDVQLDDHIVREQTIGHTRSGEHLDETIRLRTQLVRPQILDNIAVVKRRGTDLHRLGREGVRLGQGGALNSTVEVQGRRVC